MQQLLGDVEIVYTPARPGDFGGKVVLSDRARKSSGGRRARRSPRASAVTSSGASSTPRRSAEREAAAVIPAGEPDFESGPRKVLIISADIGEGHDLPARAVAREFHDEDPDSLVAIVNGLPAMGWFLTNLLRENSEFMFRWVPWLFDLQYRLFMGFAPTRWFSMKMLTLLGGRGLMRLIRAHNPDVIVSTYPGVTAVLGELRRTGRLQVPVYSSITDLAGMQFWAHPGVDLHFVTHPETIEEVGEHRRLPAAFAGPSRRPRRRSWRPARAMTPAARSACRPTTRR